MAISSTSFTPSHNSCFLAFIHKDCNHVSGFKKALTTARLLLQPSNMSSGCSSKIAKLSFTSRLRHDFKMLIGLLETMRSATMWDFIVP